MLNFNIVSIFPEFFTSPLSTSLIGKANNSKLINYNFYNPRDFSQDKHKHTDDKPYGGGPGMIMQLPPLVKAINSIENPGKILLMSPSGKTFTQSMANTFSKEKNITIICGRYEGIDSRLTEIFPIEEISTADVVLNGGETAALVIIEAISRLIPGFMGKDISANEESFSQNLLEYPQYTRPECFEGHIVPETLLNGNHAEIYKWRRKKSLSKTLYTRPDLLKNALLTKEDAETLREIPRLQISKNLSFCLIHHPVIVENKNFGTSSLTNLDIHDIGRISCSYAMGSFYIVTPLDDQRQLLASIIHHWCNAERINHQDRAKALENIVDVSTLKQAIEHMHNYHGCEPKLVASSAQWPEAKNDKLITPDQIFDLCKKGPVMLLLGTAHGLSPEIVKLCDAQVRPLRFLGYNHLSVRSAAAILADRILGDFG